MATDTRTIQTPGYGHYGEMPTYPERPDPTSEERAAARKADEISFQALVKLHRWTPAQAEYVQGTPLFRRSKIGSKASRDGRSETIHSRRRFEEARLEMLAFTKTLGKP